MFNQAKKISLLLFLMLLIFPLVARAQQSVAPISGDTWREILGSNSDYTMDQLTSFVTEYSQKARDEFVSGDLSNAVTHSLVALSLGTRIYQGTLDINLYSSIETTKESVKKFGIEESVILASVGSLNAFLEGQSTAPTETHQYTITAANMAGQPLSEVSVEIQLESEYTPNQTVYCITNESGSCPPIEYEVNRDWSQTNVPTFSSNAKVQGIKDGYYSTSTSGSKSNADDQTELLLTMVHPTDYLETGFAASIADRALRKRMLRFLDVIRLESDLVNTEVMIKGVGTSNFKGKKYLRLRVNSTTIFNSLKFNKYDMGKLLFDDTVRKILNPLNEFIVLPNTYYGFDIVVYGHIKSFADKYAGADKVEYRFLLPKSAVRSYKLKDISGQTLLNAGVQLIDDERVELKLQ